jgi:hypothetical protein
LCIEKERLQQAGVDPVASGLSSSPTSKRRQKSKLNYLLRYCPPAAQLAADSVLGQTAAANGHRIQSRPLQNLPVRSFASASNFNDSHSRNIPITSADLTKVGFPPGVPPEFRRIDYSLAMREPPPLMSIQPQAVSPKRRQSDDNIQEGPTQALPLIKVKKKHDLYGKNWKKPSADWQSESDLKEEQNLDGGGGESSACAPATDMATTLFPVGRQVKFRIFDWSAARTEALRPAEEPVKSAFFPRWLPLNSAPLAERPPVVKEPPSLAASPPRLFPGYGLVKPEPATDFCMPPAVGEEAESVVRSLSAVENSSSSSCHPEIWRQLRLHQLKMEVLDRASSFNHHHHSELLLPPSLTSSGNSDSSGGASSNNSSRSNSCILPTMEEEEESDQPLDDQPLDFSLPALSPVSPAKEAAAFGGQIRNYSVIMSPWKK